VVFTGQADHSGTTPMEMRKDALVAAAHLITYVEEVSRNFSEMEKGRLVGTVGAIKIDPGVINAIPGKVELSVDVRSITAEAKKRVAQMIQDQADTIARDREIDVKIFPIRDELPVALDETLIRMIRETCEQKGIPYEVMPSGAGHDAMQIAKMAKAGMIFIPSRRGISHSPLEWTAPEDICLGAQVLLETIIKAAQGDQ